jgi:hypothetical protein
MRAATSSGFAVVVFVLASGSTAAAAPTVTIVQPADGSAVGDGVSVSATVQSSFALSSISATIGTVTSTQTGQSTTFSDTLDISSLPLGPVTLTVTATDVGGGQGSATAILKHDHPPTLTVLTHEGAVARTNLQLQASCADADPYGCASITVTGAASASTSAATLDQTVSLASSDGMAVTLTFTATDSAGMTSTQTLPVYVDDSAGLVEVLEAGGPILDFDDTRVLFRQGSDIHLLTRGSGTDQLITTTIVQPAAIVGSLTPLGAIWTGGELRNSAVQTSGANQTLRVAGQYATWLGPPTASPPTDVYFRDVIADTTTDVMTASAIMGSDVADNGDLVFIYWTSFSNRYVARLRAGTVTTLASDSDWWQNPRTDGTNVAFGLHSSLENHLKTAEYTDSGTEVGFVDSFGTMPGGQCGEAAPPFSYSLAGGWTAFTNVTGSTGCTTLVYTRSPQGTIALASPFNMVTSVRGINANGDVAFETSDSHTYVGSAANLTSPTLVSPYALGRVYGRGTDWYVVIGDSLFHVVATTASPPDMTGAPVDMATGPSLTDMATIASTDMATAGGDDAATPLGADDMTMPPSDGGHNGGCAMAPANVGARAWIVVAILMMVMMVRQRLRTIA